MFWGTLVRCQHRTQRSIFSHLALLARERRFLFLSKLIILFAIFNLIFPSVSELEKVDAADDSEEVKLAQYEAEEKKLKVGMR